MLKKSFLHFRHNISVPRQPYGQTGENFFYGDLTLNEQSRRLSIDHQEKQYAIYYGAIKRGGSPNRTWLVSENYCVIDCILRNVILIQISRISSNATAAIIESRQTLAMKKMSRRGTITHRKCRSGMKARLENTSR